MSGIAVIQKFVSNIEKYSGHPVPPHPNVAFIEVNGTYRCGEVEDGFSTICNLHKTLEDFLQRHGSEEIVKIVLLQLAHAVDHIHENGWTHGQINLSHVYMSRSKERVVLTHPARVDHRGATDNHRAQDIQDLGVLFERILQMNPQRKINGFDFCIAQDLLQTMQHVTSQPNSKNILRHPYFWNAERKLNFLSKITQFSKAGDTGKHTKEAINHRSGDVFGSEGWMEKLEISDSKELEGYNKTLQKRLIGAHAAVDGNPPSKSATPCAPRRQRKKEAKKKMVGSETIKTFSEEVNKSTGKLMYDKTKLQSQLNFIRNRWEHFWEDKLEVQACFGYDHNTGFWKFFSRRYPKLFPTVYDAIRKSEWKEPGIADFYFETIAENKKLPKIELHGPTDGQEEPMQLG